MNVTEELLDLVGLKDKTTGRYISNSVNCKKAHQIDFKNIKSVNDGTSSMVGKNIGAVNLTMKHAKTLGKNLKCSFAINFYTLRIYVPKY